MSLKVAILGCGPAGLLAAHAAMLHGHDYAIFSRPVASQLRGAQYLHESVPDLHLPGPRAIYIFKYGDEAGYAKKLYNDPNKETSFGKMKSGPHLGWSLQCTYELLWARHEDRIVPSEIRAEDISWYEKRYNFILSTIPQKFLCQNPAHEFTYVTEYVRSGRLFLGERDVPANHIVYNGLPNYQWHRASNLDGALEYEFAQPVPGADKVMKPQWTDCDCNPGVHRLGRYGKWQRDELVTDAFNEAYELLKS